MASPLTPLFRPSRIAMIGASANPDKLSFQIFRNLRDAGFAGEIIPVNPKGELILGIPSLKSAAEIPEGTDLAVVMIPAKLVPGAMLQLGERKVKAAIVITGGFAESGEEGAALQRELANNAAQCGIRVVGPNCQGVNYPYHGLCASWPLLTRRGDMAIVSQSGTVGAALIDWASQDHLGFSAFVSLGNRADVDEADLISFFSDDPNTKVIALYIEGVKDAAKFLAAVKACRKPLVILKAGRTQQGRKAAESHTRSLAGRDEIYEAVFRQFRVHRAYTLEELYDYAKALAYVPAPPGNRVLIVTSSGGSAIIATDALEEEGFQLAPVSPELARQLREFLPAHCPIGNPIDLTGDATAAWYRKVLELADGHYDLVVTIFGDPIPGASEVIRPERCELVAYLGGADVEREERARMGERKIAVFPTPERAVKAMSRHTCFERQKFAVAAALATHTAPAAAPASLTPADSMSFLKQAALPVTPFASAANEDEALAAARDLGFPVAVKINSPDVTHKTDVGGVVLNVSDEAGVRAAFRRLAAVETAGGFRAGGALICGMAAPGVEVIIGVTRDSQFGHAVMFGIGGTMVEVMKDVSFRIVPFSEQDAAEMIGEVRGARILQGVRGAKPADVAALKKVLVQVSELVTRNPGIEELDLNPIFVSPRGVEIADARVVLASARASVG
jgi:acetate---CoA ligase (ADP-forming)